MPLITCYQCQSRVADNAPHCPHCGAPRRDEHSFAGAWENFKSHDSTRTNFPFFAGAIVGVLATLALHVFFNREDREVHFLSIGWQIAAGALIGCLVGALLRTGKS